MQGSHRTDIHRVWIPRLKSKENSKKDLNLSDASLLTDKYRAGDDWIAPGDDRIAAIDPFDGKKIATVPAP